jgi:hypothetical protein
VQLFLAPFAGVLQLVIFGVAIGLAAAIVIPVLRSTMTAEGGRQPGWVRGLTGINARWLFGFLFLAWALVFGIGLQLVPHEGADSPYGALGLIALFTGFFVMMGFLWAVIRD